MSQKQSNPYINHSGDQFRSVRRWDESGDHLVEVKKIDIQKEIDERSKGMTLGEQLARAMRGDTSVFKDGEGVYADVSEVPEMVGDSVNLNNEAFQLAALKRKKLAEAEAKLKAAQEELKKAQADNHGDTQADTQAQKQAEKQEVKQGA